MPSTTALFSALSGLTANSRNIDIIGNNISNANTTGYKSNRMLFASMFSRTFSIGTAPGDTQGGTNPGQIGLGVAIAGTQRNFNNGAISATGDSRDLAIEGNGFFIVRRDGRDFYTRAGSFRQNSTNDLVTIGGDRVMGYAVDDQYNLLSGPLEPLNIPVGGRTLAEKSTFVRFQGNLNSDGDLPTRGSSVTITGTATTGLLARASASPAPTAPDVLATTTLLTDIEDPLLPASDTPLFTVGQFFEVRGAQKGGKTLPPAQLEVTSTTTVQDLMNFAREALGITTGTGANPDGATPGLALDVATGQITITGNTGSVNDIVLDSSDMRILNADGTLNRLPMISAKSGSADGESVRTTFVAYDSLGTPVEVDIALVLESKNTNDGTTWRYYVESGDDSDIDLVAGGGTVEFDEQGQLASTASMSATIDRAGTGAESPLSLDLRFSSEQDNVTSLASTSSQLAATYRDGSPLGTLTSFSVGQDGIISGSFSNGLVRVVGQVVIATFSNPEGLVDVGNSNYTPGPNSGSPIVAAPGTLGAGRIVGGALEQSNVDLGAEFIQLILAQTGYSANTRIVRTTDDLMQQLLSLGR
jgi:flagellar hook protein FlgE